jgi:hypothetical protein
VRVLLADAAGLPEYCLACGCPLLAGGLLCLSVYYFGFWLARRLRPAAKDTTSNRDGAAPQGE